jgi:hypothetical protein
MLSFAVSPIIADQIATLGQNNEERVFLRILVRIWVESPQDIIKLTSTLKNVPLKELVSATTLRVLILEVRRTHRHHLWDYA